MRWTKVLCLCSCQEGRLAHCDLGGLVPKLTACSLGRVTERKGAGRANIGRTLVTLGTTWLPERQLLLYPSIAVCTRHSLCAELFWGPTLFKRHGIRCR